MTEGEIIVTRKQRLIGNLTAGGCILAAGVILLLSGLHVIPANVGSLAAPVLLAAVGLSLWTTAFIQHNSVALWLACLFLVPSIVGFIVEFGPVTYGQMYPLYIATPAVASLCCMPMSGNYRAHGKAIAVFGVSAALFSLQSSGLTGWGVVLPLFVVFIGLVVVYFAVRIARAPEEDEEDA